METVPGYVMQPFQPKKLFSQGKKESRRLAVIEASAGTGKTFAISHLLPRLLLEGTVDRIDQVLLVTFTNDAARELSDRTRKVLELLADDPLDDEITKSPGVHALRCEFSSAEHRQRIREALLDIDRLNVSTIHSFCQKVIQTEGVLCGWPAPPELIPDSDQLVDEILYDLWTRCVTTDPVLSSVALRQNWSPAADLAAIRPMLALDGFGLEPKPMALEKALKQLDDERKALKQAAGELGRFLERVPENCWNASGGDPAFRAGILDSLENAENFGDWLGAIEWLAGLGLPKGGHLSGKRKEAKPLQAEAAAMLPVQQAIEISHLLKQLSWSWQAFCADEVKSAVADSLLKNRQITYDGLIRCVCEALDSALSGPALASRLASQFRVALVDESQDTDTRQFQIFKKIFLNSSGSSQLVLVGDPKQAIYEFRGADVNSYLSAKHQSGDRVFTLNKTYRSPALLVDAINALFGKEGSLLKEDLNFLPAASALTHDVRLEPGSPGDGRVEVWIVPDSDGKEFSNKQVRLPKIADAVASKITEILDSEARIIGEGSRVVGARDFAVLVGNHSEAEAVFFALRSRGIPAIRAKAADIFCSEEASEMLVLLQALAEPRSRRLRSAALVTRLLGKTTSDLDDGAAKPFETDFAQKFHQWRELLERDGFAAALAEMDKSEGISLRLANSEQGERRLTNLRQLTDLVSSIELPPGVRPLVHWFAQEVGRAGGRAQIEERQQQLESDADAVHIVTMHSAKGLEYNLVFCPFLWGMPPPKQLPAVRKLGRYEQDPLLVRANLLDDGHPTLAALERAALEDRLRLAYVALTRAKVKVWICAGACSGDSGRNKNLSALDWLLRPEGDYEDLRSRECLRGAWHQEGLAAIHERFPSSKHLLVARPLPDAGNIRLAKSPTDPKPNFSAAPAPPLPTPWSMASFSSLTREKDPRGDSLPHGTPDTIGPDPSPGETASLQIGDIFLVPGGARFGTAIHDWIEDWDFSPVDAARLAGHLDGYHLKSPPGKDSNWLTQVVGRTLDNLRDVVLPGMQTPLAEVCPEPSASEWQFHLPIDSILNAQVLANALRSDPADASYAATINSLPMPTIHGFLQGFIDRIFCHAGTWGVIDWKTNFLGPTHADYQADSLLACASQSHYLLQAHLYLVALRRFLGPDVPISGAYLVFLRGIQAGTSNGILAIQPSLRQHDAFNALFS